VVLGTTPLLGHGTEVGREKLFGDSSYSNVSFVSRDENCYFVCHHPPKLNYGNTGKSKNKSFDMNTVDVVCVRVKPRSKKKKKKKKKKIKGDQLHSPHFAISRLWIIRQRRVLGSGGG
jgi:hypothetical protein